MPGDSSRRWTWLDSVLLPLAGAAMRAAWIAPPLNGLLRFMTADESAGGAGPLAFALLIGAAGTASLARRLPRGRWVVAGGGLLAMVAAQWWLLDRGHAPFWDAGWLASMAAELSSWPAAAPRWATLLASAALWWRGMTAEWTNHNDLTRSFVLGVVVLALCLALVPSLAAQVAAGLPAAIAVFLSAAWAALSLAEVSAAARQARREAATIGLNRYWLLAVLAVVASIFGLGLAAAGLITPASVTALLAALQPLWTTMGWALLGVMTALAYVMFLLLTPLLWLLRALGGEGEEQPLQQPQPFTLPEPPTPAEAASLPPALLWALRAGLLVGAALVIGLLFAWALRRYHARDEEGVLENRELIWSWDLIQGQLAGLLGRLRPATTPALFGPLPANAGDLGATVRAAYRQVLRHAAERGQPRRPGQTPSGYLPVLVTLWPEEADELQRLTAIYTASRYNPAGPSAEQAALAQASVERLFRSLDGRADGGARSRRP